MNFERAKSIAKEVLEMFPLDPVPTFAPAILDLDTLDVIKHITGRRWNEVEKAGLLDWTDWINSLDDDNFAYYLPAYMLALLEDYPTCLNSSSSNVLNLLLRRLDFTTYDTKLPAMIGRTGRRTVARFIRFFGEEFSRLSGDNNEFIELNVLSDFWDEASTDKDAQRGI